MNSASPVPGLGRRVVAGVWAGALLPFLALAIIVPAARALGAFNRVSVPAVAILSLVCAPILVLLFPRLAAPLPESLDGWLAPRHRRVAWLWGALTLLALISLARIAVFLGDPSEASASVLPGDAFLVHHSCLTAYVHGAILSKDPDANVYDLAFVSVDSHAPAPLPPTAAHFAPFNLDAFGYPPPFLLLPRALLLLTTDFMSERIIVGALYLALALLACAATAKALGGEAERRMWLLTPIFLGHPLVIVTLQIGNFHLAAVALCLLCWVAIERRRDRLGGALLAVATLAKIFPGLLGVLLLMQRRWRAVGWTCLAAAGLVALSVGVLGKKVWSDFIFYHLPKVQSGEALRFLAASPQEIEFNYAPFGIPFKLAALGLEGWGWAQAALFGTLYTAFLLVLAVVAGRVAGSPVRRLTVWLAVLVLASLRSPYAAPFVLATVVLLLLVLATEVQRWKGIGKLVAVGAVLSIPTPPTDAKVAVAVSLVRMGIVIAFLLWVVLRDGFAPRRSWSESRETGS